MVKVNYYLTTTLTTVNTELPSPLGSNTTHRVQSIIEPQDTSKTEMIPGHRSVFDNNKEFP